MRGAAGSAGARNGSRAINGEYGQTCRLSAMIAKDPMRVIHRRISFAFAGE
jgi:hypothetical protein